MPESSAQVIDAMEEVTWTISAPRGWTDPAGRMPSTTGPRALFNGVRGGADARRAGERATLSRPLDVDALSAVSATDPSGRAVENVALGSAPVTVQRSPRAASARSRSRQTEHRCAR